MRKRPVSLSVLALLALAPTLGCDPEPEPDSLPSAPLSSLEPRSTGMPYIELHLSTWIEPGRGDIALQQGGTTIDVDVMPDATTGTIAIVPLSILDPSQPYELDLSADLTQAMEPYGPLWITPGDPDCDSVAEFQVDGDEDGIPDCNEKVGTYYWGMPLNFWGASPGQTDIFVEVHYLDEPNGVEMPWLRPWPQALAKVRDAFADRGYAVHFDVGDLYETPGYDGDFDRVGWAGAFNLDGLDHGHPFVGNIPWASPNPACKTNAMDSCFSGNTGWSTWPANNFLESYVSQMMPGRERSFYYVMFANESDDGDASGRTTLAASNAIITLGHFGGFVTANPGGQPHNLPADDYEQRNKIINYQSAVLMHEMGHMLGLKEGGDVQVEGKPNYLSSMSYVHMFPGLPQSYDDLRLRYQNYQAYYQGNGACPDVYLSQLANGPLGYYGNFSIGYSDGTAATLDEQSLSEAAGVGNGPWGMAEAVSWDCDGNFGEVLPNHDITGAGWYIDPGECGVSEQRIDAAVTDHDDWSNIELYHRAHFLSGVWPQGGMPFECPFP